MVYFDNAATTYPKPVSVISAMSKAMVNYGANPGRSGHKLSMETAEAVFRSREKCAEFFGAETENTVFMLNCTYALNMAIKGILTKNSHIITSDLEHNAVIRPVHAASKENGITYSVAHVSENDDETVRNFEKLINPHTKAVVCTCASNVTGQILPYRKIGEMCVSHGLCFILDAAQGSGVLPINLSDDNINIICSAGHKGLYGPMGTGLMITDGKYRLKTIIEGGTGSASKEIEQPEFLPDRFESGTINTSGAISLGAGIDFVTDKGVDTIYNHEWKLCKLFFDEIRKNPQVVLYSEEYGRNRVPIVPFNIEGMSSEEAAGILSREGFFLRGGFHCAFLAHNQLGTSEIGAVRFAPSVFNTRAEVIQFIRTVNRYTSRL